MTTPKDTPVSIIRKLQKIINAHLRIEEQPIAITKDVCVSTREAHCLQAIGENEGSNVKAVGDILGVTKSAASQMIGKLMKRGFAVKRQANDNNKDILVFLTESGWNVFKLHQDFHERHMNTLRQRLKKYDESELEIIDEAMALFEEIMRKRMNEIFGK